MTEGRFILGPEVNGPLVGCELYHNGRWHRASAETKERAWQIVQSMAGLKRG